MTTKTFEDMLAEIRRQIEDLEGQIEDSRHASTATRSRCKHVSRAGSRGCERRKHRPGRPCGRRPWRSTTRSGSSRSTSRSPRTGWRRSWPWTRGRSRTPSKPSCATGMPRSNGSRHASRRRHSEAREQAEAEVAALKQARNRAAERLIALRASSDDAWHTHRERVGAALDELERRVREAALKIQGGETHDD